MKSKDVDSTLRALANHARTDTAEPADAPEADRRALLEPLGLPARKRALDVALAELCEEPAAPSARIEATPANDAPAAPVRGRLGALITTLALAAAIAFFFIARPGVHSELGGVPSYELTIAGGAAPTRGDPPSGTPVLAPGARIALMLRPATRVEGAVEAKAHLVRDGHARALPLDATVTPEGAIKLSGVLAELPEAPGPAELVVTIVRPGGAHDPLAAPSRSAEVVKRPVVLSKGGE